ncbi:hypothetical protein [Leifsonia shinshuensis]
MSDTDNHRPNVLVSYGEAAYLARWVSTQRWNGWLCPSFTREVADQLAADLARDEAENPDPTRIVPTWSEEHQTYLLQSSEYAAEGYEPEPADRWTDDEGTTLYAIGAGFWTWYEAEAQAS